MQKQKYLYSGNKFNHEQGEIAQGDMAFPTSRSVNKHILLVLGVHHRARNDVEICCPCYLCRSSETNNVPVLHNTPVLHNMP